MEEKKKILEMLETGKISAEEAVKLLDALKKSFGPMHFGPGPFGLHRHKMAEMRKKMKKMRKHMRHMRVRFHDHDFGPWHHDPGKKKVIIKMVGDCDFEDADLICCD